MSDFIEVYENIVPPELCDDVIASYERVAKEEPERMRAGHTQLPAGKMFREDYSFQLEEVDDRSSSSIFDFLDDVVHQYQEKYAILNGISYTTMRLKIQKTPVGGGYHGWHCETMTPSSSNRLIVWTIYLNDIEEGGETEFLYQNKRIKSTKGSICLFPASYTHAHRGNPPLSNEKYILTGWFHIQEPR
jgi:hypothetical protein